MRRERDGLISMSDSWFEDRICDRVVNGLDFSACFEAIALNGAVFCIALVALLLCCIAARRPVMAEVVSEAKYEWSTMGMLYVACSVVVYAAPWIAVGVETGFQPSRTGLDQLIAAIFQSLTGPIIAFATKYAILRP